MGGVLRGKLAVAVVFARFAILFQPWSLFLRGMRCRCVAKLMKRPPQLSYRSTMGD